MLLFRALISVVHQQFNRKHNDNNLATFWEWLPNLSISNYVAAILKKHGLIILHVMDIQMVEFLKQNSYLVVYCTYGAAEPRVFAPWGQVFY